MPWAVVGLIGLCVLVELGLQLGSLAGAGQRLRLQAYEYGAFWPGLLRDWQPNYLGQRELMFVSYAFLHGGLLHLGMNMATLWSLGRAVVDRVGQRGFLFVYLAATLGGALAYGLLMTAPQPMVGASGALFGLAGALIIWSWEERAAQNLGLAPILRAIMMLVGINVVMWWALDGHLAWQTHLGGALAGAALAPFLPHRPLAEEDSG